ncbi:MAG: endo-1,4-beta-xylanase [Bacteroidaceae bacterium]|nr:endo-1,4-beta-xylanase [Bacteroidaceae bacterium]
MGNITTEYNVDYGKEPFRTLWNQITCENESKWASVEGTRGSFNWSGADRAFNYAKQHGFTYKFHALVWGAQYPGWLESLSANDRYAAIVTWFNAVKNKYSTLPMIDVVNEAVGLHQNGNPMIKESLGGGGKTGYDWLIKAFEMAYERWPDAILIYNDYNTFQWDTDNYITLVQTLRDAGAPIDAYGCQSHDLTDCDFTKFKNAESRIQTALKMPMYSTEYDIGTGDDALQETRYKEQIPYMWEKDYCAGITLWGYIYGHTWTTNGNSGIIKDGVDRPAMTWLREYMQTDAARNAKSPFPGMKKEASVYIRPASMNVARGDTMSIMVRARMATKTIEKVELYDGTELIATMTEAPYLAEYTSTTPGQKTLKAVVTATDGETYERLSRITVVSSPTKRTPYSETIPQLPGTINITEYDRGASGVSYYNASRSVATTSDGAWMEYTVDVAEDGIYAFDAEVASTSAEGKFHLAEYTFDNITYLSEFISVPKTGSVNTYKSMHGQLLVPLTAGRHVLTLLIDKGGFRIKNITFTRYEEDKYITATVSTIRPNIISVGDTTVITISSKSTTSTIDHVNVYANNLLIGTLTESPYTVEFVPTEKGTYSITAIATNAEGKCRTSAAKTLRVNGKRQPYRSVISIPGTIEAENFDRGGEGLSFHDSDATREGDANYRTDAEGVDFVKGNNGTCIGYTAANEWLEYSIIVTEPGKYSYEAVVSSGTTNSGFNIGLVKGSKVTTVAKVSVPQTASNDWGTYKTVTGDFTQDLEEGNQILRITITGANCNIDKIKLICTLNTGVEEIKTIEPGKQVAYNLQGMKVDDTYKGIVIINGRKVLRK